MYVAVTGIRNTSTHAAGEIRQFELQSTNRAVGRAEQARLPQYVLVSPEEPGVELDEGRLGQRADSAAAAACPGRAAPEPQRVRPRQPEQEWSRGIQSDEEAVGR